MLIPYHTFANKGITSAYAGNTSRSTLLAAILLSISTEACSNSFRFAFVSGISRIQKSAEKIINLGTNLILLRNRGLIFYSELGK